MSNRTVTSVSLVFKSCVASNNKVGIFPYKSVILYSKPSQIFCLLRNLVVLAAMKGRKKFTLISLFVAWCVVDFNPAYSQYNLDYGGLLGVSNYLGEIGGTKKPGQGEPGKPFIADMRLDQTKFAVGGWIRYKVHPLVSVKANLAFIRIGAADSTSDYLNRRTRNLSFRNDIYELNTQLEYNFYSANNISPRGRKIIDFNAYGFVGGGMFWHNPKAKYQGKWEALQPLGTEGQGVILGLKQYNRVQAQLSSGLGFYYTFKRKWRLGWELGTRWTFTDYLDDVSTRYVDPALLQDGTPTGDMAAALSNRTNTKLAEANNLITGMPGSIRGNPEKNDWYMYTAATLGYVVRGKGNFYKQKYRLLTGNKRRKKRTTRAKF